MITKLFDEQFFIDSIKESYKKYEEYGPRSPEKLRSIHEFIAISLKNIWGNHIYEYFYNSFGNKELKVDGKYYPKDIDITVTKNKKAIFCVWVKFITSNYKQNANNYFEWMMWETANIQANNNLPYVQIIIFRDETPYLKKSKSYNDAKIVWKIERITDKDLQKYLNLEFDTNQAHKPFAIGIIMIHINEDTKNINIVDFDDIVENKDTAILLKNKLSFEQFFKKVDEYRLFLNSK